MTHTGVSYEFAGALGDLAAALPDPVILLNAAGEVRWGNTAAEQLFGITLSDGAGRSMLDFLHPDDVEMALVSVTAMQRKEVGTLLEMRVRAADGWRLVEARGRYFGADMLVIVRDITDRRRWEVVGDEAAGFRAVMQNAASITVIVEPDGTIRSSSAPVTRLLGRDQELLEGAPFALLVDTVDQPQLATALDAVRRPGAPPLTTDLRLVHHDASVVPFALTFTNLIDDPTLGAVVVTGHDVSDRVGTEAELRESNSLLATTLDSTADGILVVDRRGRIVTFNRAFAAIWSLPDAVLDKRDDDEALAAALRHVRDPDEFLAKVHEVYASPDTSSQDVVHLNDGRVFERDSYPRALDGKVVGRVWTFRDITEHEQLKQLLRHQALHDSLTKLANQTLFRDRIDHAIARLRRTERGVAVLFIDLDDFKNVNDTLGHWVGDELLVQMSERLTRELRQTDTAARLGGDEFAVLLDQLTDDHDAVTISQRILAALQQPIDIAQRRLTLTASIGIAFGDQTTDTDELLRNADLAMYNAKAQGKNCRRVFTPEMHASAVAGLESLSISEK